MEIRFEDQLSPETEARYFELKEAEFEEPWTDEMQDMFGNERDSRLGTLLVYEEEHLIGGARIYRREIEYDGGEAVLGGIGGVWVRRDKQRLGIATQVLESCMDWLNQAGCEVGFLCTDIEKLESLYGRLGFVPLGRTYTFMGVLGKRCEREDGMIAPIMSDEVFKKILKGDEMLDLGVGNW